MEEPRVINIQELIPEDSIILLPALEEELGFKTQAQLQRVNTNSITCALKHHEAFLPTIFKLYFRIKRVFAYYWGNMLFLKGKEQLLRHKY